MIGDAITLLDFIQRRYTEHKIISALFDWDGKRLQGDQRLEVQVYPDKDNEDRAWYYSIKPLDDYEFIRIPVNAGAVIESLGTFPGEKNAFADYFRYIQVPDGHIYGGLLPNVKVKFMVFAYRPSDLLAAGKGRI